MKHSTNKFRHANIALVSKLPLDNLTTKITLMCYTQKYKEEIVMWSNERRYSVYYNLLICFIFSVMKKSSTNLTILNILYEFCLHCYDMVYLVLRGR